MCAGTPPPPNFGAVCTLRRARRAPNRQRDRGEAQAIQQKQMALAAVVFSLGACREGWLPLGSRCVYQTAGQLASSACAADCASVVRPWVANDTGGVLMCIKSQEEYDFLHTWVGREYWSGFQRLGLSDGVTPPVDWRTRTGVVHPQGSACSAATNPWFDSLMSHQGACPLLERCTCTAHPASHLPLRGCTAAVEEYHPVWSLNEPSNRDVVVFSDNNGEQNCILHEQDQWRNFIAQFMYAGSPGGGYWCA